MNLFSERNYMWPLLEEFQICSVIPRAAMIALDLEQFLSLCIGSLDSLPGKNRRGEHSVS